MTEDQARTAANLLMVAAAAAAVVYVVRTPPLRRRAWGLVRAWVTGTAAVWTVNLLRESWAESRAA